jgi:hypothetical protein
MIFALCSLIALAAAQLDSAQFSALKSVWSSLGCAAPLCPDFAATDPCPATASATLGCASGRVTKIDLVTMRLSGSLNGPALGVLTGLTELDLNGHSLTTIPKQIGNLSALTLLDLANCSLIGTVPAEIGNLSNLGSLALQNNKVTGTLPQLSALTKLTQLLAFNNPGLQGALPALPTSTTRVWLFGCGFTALPPNLSSLTALNSLQLQQNKLVGAPQVLTSASIVTCWLQRAANETNCLACPSDGTLGKCECFPCGGVTPSTSTTNAAVSTTTTAAAATTSAAVSTVASGMTDTTASAAMQTSAPDVVSATTAQDTATTTGTFVRVTGESKSSSTAALALSPIAIVLAFAI